ncbi:MAG: cytochrome C oxidase subunit IV family protein [Rhizobiales bacterium]|nr:cytochrome C oxidase subunit IV family protein [Hyphomicrobiales bacterium]
MIRLALVWLVMAALTLAAIPIGHAADARPLGPALVVALLAAAFAKASLLLNDYLELRHAPAWNKAMRAGVFALLAILAGLSLAARLA